MKATKLLETFVLRSPLQVSTAVALLITLLLVKDINAESNDDSRRCHWCGPLAEQVHRSRRAPPCDAALLSSQVTICEPGYHYCAIVAVAPPHVESRYCVKLFQDECYPLYCNTTNTWKMTCPCRGDLCNGVNTDREKEAFAELSKLSIRTTPAPNRRRTTNSQKNIIKREVNELNNATTMSIEVDAEVKPTETSNNLPCRQETIAKLQDIDDKNIITQYVTTPVIPKENDNINEIHKDLDTTVNTNCEFYEDTPKTTSMANAEGNSSLPEDNKKDEINIIEANKIDAQSTTNIIPIENHSTDPKDQITHLEEKDIINKIEETTVANQDLNEKPNDMPSIVQETPIHGVLQIENQIANENQDKIIVNNDVDNMQTHNEDVKPSELPTVIQTETSAEIISTVTTYETSTPTPNVVTKSPTRKSNANSIQTNIKDFIVIMSILYFL